MAIKNPHHQSLATTLNSLLEFYHDDPSNSSTRWNLLADRGGIQSYTFFSKKDKIMPIIRCDGVIEGWSTNDIIAVINSMGARRTWDEKFDQGQLIKRYSSAEWLTYYTLKGSFPITHRDLAVATAEYIDEDSVHYLYECSVADTLVPAVSGRVRAHLHMGGWVLCPSKRVARRVYTTFIAHMDVRGALPQTLMHALMQNNASCVNHVARYLTRWGYPTHRVVVEDDRISILAESFEQRGAVYDLVFRAKDCSMPDVEIRCSERMYPDGFIVQVSSREHVKWKVLDEESLNLLVDNEEKCEAVISPTDRDWCPENEAYGWRIRISMDTPTHAVQIVIRRQEDDQKFLLI